MKKIFSVILIGLLAVSMAFAAAGCGEKDASSKTSKTSSKASSQSANSATQQATQQASAAVSNPDNEQNQNTNNAVVNAARSYFALDANAQVNVLDSVTLEDGSTYYHVSVPMGETVSTLYIHSSGYPYYTEDAFNNLRYGSYNSGGQQEQGNDADYSAVESYADTDSGNGSQQSYGIGDEPGNGDYEEILGPDGATP